MLSKLQPHHSGKSDDLLSGLVPHFIKGELLMMNKQQYVFFFFLQELLKCIKSISAMCPREMRNPAPAWLKGLATEYLGGGISAVGAQHTALQLHKSRGMNTIMNALCLNAAHVLLRYIQPINHLGRN